MKKILILSLLASSLCVAHGQETLDNVLRAVEANNKELQAAGQLTQSKKLEASMANNLADPSVSYIRQYGNREGLGIQGELVASQSFDFPTLYAQRHKLIQTQSIGYDRQYSEVRQQVLLQAKEVCFDLILLNQQKVLLDQRLANAEQLQTLYAKRLEQGDANVLETNKIALELLNVKTEARLNESARATKLQELAVLNGGETIVFTDTVYPAMEHLLSFQDLYNEALAYNPQLLALQNEQEVARRQITVNRQKGLPGFELGYKLNHAEGGNRFNGFLVGISIPLFSNRNNVRTAKVQAHVAELQLQNTQTALESELHQLFNRAQALKTSMDEYETVLRSLNSLALLNKAIGAGQLSMIEYIVDVTTLYDSMQNHMQLQNEYHKVMAQLYRYKL